MEWLFILLVVALLGGAIVLAVIGLRSSREEDPLEERLAEFADRGEAASLEEIELSQPFMDRVVYPTARKLGEIAQRFTPQNLVEQTARKLERAGNPRGLDPMLFLSLRLVTGIGLGIAVVLLSSIGPDASIFSLRSLLLITIAILIGFYLPDILIGRRIRARQNEVRRSLPEALDLLTICVEAGLAFDAAMQKVNEKWDNELALAFGRALQEMQLGKLRREALRAMSDRLDVSELDSFVAAVIQSEQLGVSIANILRIQADDMRVRRRQLAEELAQKAPVKMLLPMAFLIFPTIMMILLGPAALLMLRSALGGILF